MGEDKGKGDIGFHRSPLIVRERDDVIPLRVALDTYTNLPETYLWVVPDSNYRLHYSVWNGCFAGREALPDVLLKFLRRARGEAG